MKRKIFILLCFVIIGLRLTAQENAITRYRNIFRKALQAEQQSDYASALVNYQEILGMGPHDGDTQYRIARLQSLLGEHEKSLSSLKQALILGYDFGDQLDSTLAPLQKMKTFGTLQKLIKKMQTPVSTSEVAFTISEKDLIPEGIAYDPVEECFYLSSCWKHKIVKIEKNGTTADFTEERQDGLRTVLGMHVDAKRRVLWAASVITRERPDMDIGEVGWSGLFKYNLKNGKLIKKYTLYEEGVKHLFNDIAITSQGDVYVTDTKYQAIYTIHHDRDVLELFLKPDCFLYPNGITIGGNDRTLYMASSGNGVYRIDIPTKSYQLLDQPDDISLCGIDGMYFYYNSLVCVQNGYNRISRFYLNPEGDTVQKLQILETRNPHFIIPTTGAIAEDTFYFIANSQLRAYDETGNLLPLDQLHDVVILRSDLK